LLGIRVEAKRWPKLKCAESLPFSLFYCGDKTTMLVVRLTLSGSKKRPFYHVVVADSRCSRDGRFIEQVGYFNPIARGKEVRLHLELEKIQARVATGAQVSDRVKRLIKEFQQQMLQATAEAA
jgi:small subunit ribosomal protein S16